MKIEQIVFVKLKDNETLKGIFAGFGKNQYGIFIKILENAKLKTAKCLSLNTVLKNIIKANLDMFDEGTNIEIKRHGKAKGKKYIVYTVNLNGKELESRNYDLDKDELKNLL